VCTDGNANGNAFKKARSLHIESLKELLTAGKLPSLEVGLEKNYELNISTASHTFIASRCQRDIMV
jgi:hypothetical protein